MNSHPHACQLDSFPLNQEGNSLNPSFSKKERKGPVSWGLEVGLPPPRPSTSSRPILSCRNLVRNTYFLWITFLNRKCLTCSLEPLIFDRSFSIPTWCQVRANLFCSIFIATFAFSGFSHCYSCPFLPRNSSPSSP